MCARSAERSEMSRAWVCKDGSCRDRAGGESPSTGRSHGSDAQGSGAGSSHLETPSSGGVQEKDGF